MDFESLFDIPLMICIRLAISLMHGCCKKNTALLKQIQQRTGCKILLAQKAFSMFSAYPLIRDDLAGTTASGLFEAKLGREHFGKEVHVFSPCLHTGRFHTAAGTLRPYCIQLVWTMEKIPAAGARCNPEYFLRHSHQSGYAEVETDLYNPCISGSRMGVPLEQMEDDFAGLDGIHFHTMCEQNSDVLERTLDHMLPQFDKWLKRCKWVNFGGGHHITRPDYDVERLVRCIERVRDTYGVQVYLEPGEAVALNAGYLVATVLDVVHNGMDIAILDASAACHMPDVLEMPYRPHILYSGTAGEKLIPTDLPETPALPVM